jgi:hypothetical protein
VRRNSIRKALGYIWAKGSTAWSSPSSGLIGSGGYKSSRSWSASDIWFKSIWSESWSLSILKSQNMKHHDLSISWSTYTVSSSMSMHHRLGLRR